jgi:hypothetical protein
VIGALIPFPQELRPRLPTIVGNVDYLTLERRLQQIDALLIQSGSETEFVQRSLDRWMAASGEAIPSVIEQLRFQKSSRQALRCNLLRTLLQEDFRGFSRELAGSPLYQWFCAVDALETVRVPSKSQLQRFAHWLPEKEMVAFCQSVIRTAVQQPERLGLNRALELEEYFVDSTCLTANIHFPVDWVLLRDAVRTLMKATLRIREQGLKGRMQPPEEFLRRINRLAIQMTQAGRRGGSTRERKRVLREIKQLVGVVRCHARRHRQLLDQNWARTEWSRAEAEVVLLRLDGVMELLPRALKQAHERIIGERPVKNADKLLSLYEPEVRVIVRGKAGAEVEFGNTLLIAENRQGVILDFELFQETAPADSRLLLESLLRVEGVVGRKVGAVVTDRGFASAANSRTLDQSDTHDATCPRQPARLREKMQDAQFARRQRRRAQTEGRIGILKNGFLGRPLRAKGFEHRALALCWGVLTHNLWKIARIGEEQQQELEATRRRHRRRAA